MGSKAPRAPVVTDDGARATLPPFGAEHEELRGTVARFVTAEVAPHVDEWERAEEFPRDLYRRCAELGFLGLKFPERYGGQGGDHLHDAVWVEELARSGGSGGVAAGLNAHASIALPPIFNFGTEEQRRRWLVPGIAGEKIGALGITEPGAGSDVAGIKTTARKVDGGYVVNGSKTFITNGVRADFLVCACRTTEAGGHDGISFLVLERDMPGYEVARKLEKLGWRSSDTAELSFTDVEVPAANLLGEENGGFGLIMANFAWERLLMAVGAVGAMQRLLDSAVTYAKEREAFGRPIGRFQAIRHQIAEMATKAEASRALTYEALRLFHAGQPCIREVSMAKLLTQRAALEIADQTLQIHGGYGYTREFGIERAVRDARLGPIGGGTDEVMKEIIGKTYGL
ncbi:MAG TPA: acyl-CoA dehydrogenase family protein, partial [Solirubrobacterales bacterium]|nr:acyl-CoA dehydrogenase family protein [Solirubrobacterales bacterium]